MKKRIFAAVAALCLMAGTGAFAQNGKQARSGMREMPTAEQMARRQTDRLKEKLSLTDAQEKQVYEYNLQQIKEMQAQRERMRAARQAEAQKMKTILTPEQYAQWQQLQGQARGMRAKQGDCKGSGKEGAKCGKACGKSGGKSGK